MSTETMEGVFLGALQRSWHFEFKLLDGGKEIRGRISEELESTEQLDDRLNTPMKVTFNVVPVGQSRPKYTLASLDAIINVCGGRDNQGSLTPKNPSMQVGQGRPKYTLANLDAIIAARGGRDDQESLTPKNPSRNLCHPVQWTRQHPCGGRNFHLQLTGSVWLRVFGGEILGVKEIQAGCDKQKVHVFTAKSNASGPTFWNRKALKEFSFGTDDLDSINYKFLLHPNINRR